MPGTPVTRQGAAPRPEQAHLGAPGPVAGGQPLPVGLRQAQRADHARALPRRGRQAPPSSAAGPRSAAGALPFLRQSSNNIANGLKATLKSASLIT